MTDARAASEEIEQTLHVVRDRVEMAIANYRSAAFIIMVAVTSCVELLQEHRAHVGTVITPIYFACCVVYSLVLRALVRRIGARDGLVMASAVLDVAAVVAIFFVIHRFGSPRVVRESQHFATHLLGTSTILVLLVNSLRASVAASLIGGITAAILVPATLIPIEGFHPAIIPLCASALLAGGVSAIAARQTRSTLDSFARLHLLRRYLSPAAVDRVMRENPDAAMSLGGRLVTCTLLAADLRGFTSMSEKLAPDEIVRQLNAYHGTMLEQIERHAGALDKFIGDGILAVFGLVEARPDAGASDAVACARGMLEALAKHNGERASVGQTPLRMGIGLHTGTVVAGNIGAPGRRLEFTVIGDAVNTASRLESLTKEAQTNVLISADTVDRLETRTGLSELPPMQAKGKADALRVFGFDGDRTVTPSA